MRIVKIGIAGVLLSQSLMAWGRPLEEIKTSKELRACLAPLADYLFKSTPSKCTTNCVYSGMAYDYMVAFAKHLGVSLKVKEISWDAQFHNEKGITDREATYTPQLLKTGECDIYPTHLTRNAWRLKKLDFVIVFPNRMLLVAKKIHKKQFIKVTDLGGKLISTVKDTSYHTWLDQANATILKDNPIKIVIVNDGELADSVARGKADATVLDSDFAVHVTQKTHRDLTTTIGVGDPEEIGWAFRQEDKSLQETAKKFIEEQVDNPKSTINQSWTQYIGVSLKEFRAALAELK